MLCYVMSAGFKESSDGSVGLSLMNLICKQIFIEVMFRHMVVLICQSENVMESMSSPRLNIPLKLRQTTSH